MGFLFTDGLSRTLWFVWGERAGLDTSSLINFGSRYHRKLLASLVQLANRCPSLAEVENMRQVVQLRPSFPLHQSLFTAFTAARSSQNAILNLPRVSAAARLLYHL